MFFNLFLFYQVVWSLCRKSVNKYLYLYLYLYTSSGQTPDLKTLKFLFNKLETSLNHAVLMCFDIIAVGVAYECDRRTDGQNRR